MSRKHRQSERKAERKQKRLGWRINQNLAKFEITEQINQNAAIAAEIPDYGDKLKENFLFSFVHYKIGQCGLKNLNDQSSKQLIKKLKNINETKVCDLPKSRLIRDDVKNSGDYTNLYHGLSPDVEIKEVEFSDRGRIFVYFVERYVCVVAINPNHINTR
jgi:hypothetical protein